MRLFGKTHNGLLPSLCRRLDSTWMPELLNPYLGLETSACVGWILQLSCHVMSCRQQVQQALRHNPPEAVVALQTRLAALYPEYTICYLPLPAWNEDRPFIQEEEDDDTRSCLTAMKEDLSAMDEADNHTGSCFWGSAVCHTDWSNWQPLATPEAGPAKGSPWVAHHGFYHNGKVRQHQSRRPSMNCNMTDRWGSLLTVTHGFNLVVSQHARSVTWHDSDQVLWLPSPTVLSGGAGLATRL